MTEIAICNQALGWLGAKPISSFDDPTNEAQLCSDNYEPIRDAVLEERAWTFADKAATLTDPVPGGWGEAGPLLYELPDDVIRVYRVYRRVHGPQPVAVEGWRREGNYIAARYSGTIYLMYTARVTEVGEFTAGFTQTLAARIAADLAMAITRSRKMQEDMWNLYQQKLRDAAATDAGQARSERTDSVELVRTRFADGLQV